MAMIKKKVQLGSFPAIRFNIMLVGESGLGKTVFINSLLGPFASYQDPNSNPNDLKDLKCDFLLDSDTCACHVHVTEVNNLDSSAEIQEYLRAEHLRFLRINTNRLSEEERNEADGRIHCLFYCLPPGRLNKVDTSFLRELCRFAPVVPVVLKADTLTNIERQNFLVKVKAAINNIQQDLEIPVIYDFPEEVVQESSGIRGECVDDPSEPRTTSCNGSPTTVSTTVPMPADLQEIEYSHIYLPPKTPKTNRVPSFDETDGGAENIFAVICTDRCDGVRSYPWGCIDTAKVGDLSRMQSLLLQDPYCSITSMRRDTQILSLSVLRCETEDCPISLFLWGIGQSLRASTSLLWDPSLPGREGAGEREGEEESRGEAHTSSSLLSSPSLPGNRETRPPNPEEGEIPNPPTEQEQSASFTLANTVMKRHAFSHFLKQNLGLQIKRLMYFLLVLGILGLLRLELGVQRDLAASKSPFARSVIQGGNFTSYASNINQSSSGTNGSQTTPTPYRLRTPTMGGGGGGEGGAELRGQGQDQGQGGTASASASASASEDDGEGKGGLQEEEAGAEAQGGGGGGGANDTCSGSQAIECELEPLPILLEPSLWLDRSLLKINASSSVTLKCACDKLLSHMPVHFPPSKVAVAPPEINWADRLQFLPLALWYRVCQATLTPAKAALMLMNEQNSDSYNNAILYEDEDEEERLNNEWRRDNKRLNDEWLNYERREIYNTLKMWGKSGQVMITHTRDLRRNTILGSFLQVLRGEAIK